MDLIKKCFSTGLLPIIMSMIIRTPAKLRKKSCGYSLYVKNDFSDALKIIKDNNVRYIGTSAVDYI